MAGFVRDWLRAAAILVADSPLYRRLHRVVTLVFLEWTPVLLRLVMVLLLIAKRQVSPLLLALEVAMVLAIGTGLAGRGAAAVLMLPAMLAARTIRSDVWFVCLLLVLVLGTGRLSLWSPERRLFQRDAG